MKFGFKGQKGFSIIELMVVVGIIGVLAAVGLPKMQVFLAKSKRAEVKSTLGAYKTFQSAYYTDGGGYGTSTQIGFTNMNSTYTFAETTSATAYTAYMNAATNRLCAGSPSESWSITQAAGIIGDANANKMPACN